MAIYRLEKEEKEKDKLSPLTKTTFTDENVTEKQIQRLIREQIETVSEGTLVIDEEYSGWDKSKRRIDLLCIDKSANLVVVELKRTESGEHMDLQAIRYGAMISTMTFDEVVDAHRSFLKTIDSADDAEQRILDFLGWDEPKEDAFAQDVRLVLASGDFSKELTSSVLWLNDKGVDIRCVKMEPYVDGERIYLDIQQVIPLQETADFQIKVRRKKQIELQEKKDLSKFTLRADDIELNNLYKRHLIYEIVKVLIGRGSKPDVIQNDLKGIKKGSLFVEYDGKLSESEVVAELKQADSVGSQSKSARFFCKEDQLFYVNNRTYALTNQWGKDTVDAAKKLCSKYPNIEFEKE